MLVVDWECSERSPQRRLDAQGRRLHCCCVCKTLAAWGSTWSAYYSEKELDDAVPIPKFCSDPCRASGGPRARNVTTEMKRSAKESEMREPTIAWREATDREKKYDAAASAQRSLK